MSGGETKRGCRAAAHDVPAPLPPDMVAWSVSWVLTVRFETPREKVRDGTLGRHSPAPGTPSTLVTRLVPGEDWGRLRGEGASCLGETPCLFVAEQKGEETTSIIFRDILLLFTLAWFQSSSFAFPYSDFTPLILTR